MKSISFSLLLVVALISFVGCGGGGGGGDDGSWSPDDGVLSDEGASNMVSVPAGEGMIGYRNKKYLANLGKSKVKANRAKRKRFDAFQIDKYEVTLHNYYLFYKQLDAETKKDYRPRHHIAKSHPYWKKGRYKKGKGDFPVTGITYQAAVAYAAWRGKRLPDKYEWQYAARGKAGNMWSGGDTFDASRYNVSDSWDEGNPKLVEVNGSKNAKDVSPFGIVGMGGNASEWATSKSTAKYNVADAEGKIAKGERQILRLYAICGPNYGTRDKMDCLLANWYHTNPKGKLRRDKLLMHVGFRCAK